MADFCAAVDSLLKIFDDFAFPDFGAEIEIAGAAECIVAIYGAADFQPGPIAELIRRCCQESLKTAPIGFDWSYSCTRPRRDSFGGGWCAIFTDHVEFATTQEELARRLGISAATPPGEPPGPWIDDPAYPLADWKTEVGNGDTRLGYLDWALARTEADHSACSPTGTPSA